MKPSSVQARALPRLHLAPGPASSPPPPPLSTPPPRRPLEFLITTGPGPVPRLDGLNLVFGRVTGGMTTVRGPPGPGDAATVTPLSLAHKAAARDPAAHREPPAPLAPPVPRSRPSRRCPRSSPTRARSSSTRSPSSSATTAPTRWGAARGRGGPGRGGQARWRASCCCQAAEAACAAARPSRPGIDWRAPAPRPPPPLQVRRRYGRPLKAIVITEAGVVGEAPAPAGGAAAAAQQRAASAAEGLF
jgi:hypothetical protein